MEYLFGICVALVAWPYLGYPCWLLVLRAFRAQPDFQTPVDLPSVSLLISAFNEQGVIANKIENSLALEYPKDLLQVIVISDASTDSTDEIVHRYSSHGVRLIRQTTQLGKSAGLTLAVPETTGDIIVFTDANSMFHVDALAELVQPFTDPKIGYVVGQQRYVSRDADAVNQSEGLYWRYETWIKKQESRVGSVVGGDGAIYAIRRELFQPLRNTDINDFVNPLQIVVKGYRGVYQEDAVCTEETAGTFEGEFRRKVRIVNRSVRAVSRVPLALNPLRTGLFAFHLFSHKVLRWLAGFFMLGALLANLAWVLLEPGAWSIGWLVAQAGFYALAVGGLIPVARHYRLVSIPFYFCLANLAATKGVWSFLRGQAYVVWTPDRETAAAGRGVRRKSVVVLFWGGLLFGGVLASVFPLAGISFAVFAILYTYGIYPFLIAVAAQVKPKVPVSVNPGEKDLPTLGVIVPAYNEEQWIEEKIRNTLELDYPADRLSVWIVDDRSDDRTLEIAAKYRGRVNLLSTDRRSGKAAALQLALDSLDSQLVLFTDANVLIHADAPRQLVARMLATDASAVTGNVSLVSSSAALHSESTYQSFELSLQHWESCYHTAVSVDGGLYLVRRSEIPIIPNGIILDDLAICGAVIHQGGKVDVAVDARASEVSTPSLRQELGRRIRMGKGVSQLLQLGCYPTVRRPLAFGMFFSHKIMRWSSPFLLIVGCLAVIRISWGTDWFVPTMVALAGTMALSVAGLIVPGVRRLTLFNLLGYCGLGLLGNAWGMLLGMMMDTSPLWEHGQRSSVSSMGYTAKERTDAPSTIRERN